MQSHGVFYYVTSGFSSPLYSYAHYFLIRRNAALLRRTECEAGEFFMLFYFANITVTEIDLDSAI